MGQLGPSAALRRLPDAQASRRACPKALLDRVDIISSVSGGSVTAALYALSCEPTKDPEDKCPRTVENTPRCAWTYGSGDNPFEVQKANRITDTDRLKDCGTVFKRMLPNFEWSWVGNWFWPENIVRYWFTDFDRSNIMAETLSDNLYDHSFLDGESLGFQDINPRRPALIVNATNFTRPSRRSKKASKDIDLFFSFTKAKFKELHSNLDHYPIAYAVMASSAFPGVFSYVTLRDFSVEAGNKPEYFHLFNGGSADNLGLKPLEKIFEGLMAKSLLPERVIVIKIDFSLGSGLINSDRR